MAKRRETGDLMADLLGGPEQSSGKTESQQIRKTSNQQDGETAETERVKVTVYIREETGFALEQAKLILRQKLKPENLNSISKSAIVEAALAMALGDLEENGTESQLARKLS